MSTDLIALDPRTLAARKEADAVEKLRQRYERIQKRDLDIVDGMNRVADVPMTLEKDRLEEFRLLIAEGSEADIRRAGWKSRQQLRLAYYGTLPYKDWPAGMRAAHERVGMRIRRADKESKPAIFNLNMISIPAPRSIRDDDAIVVLPTKE